MEKKKYMMNLLPLPHKPQHTLHCSFFLLFVVGICFLVGYLKRLLFYRFFFLCVCVLVIVVCFILINFFFLSGSFFFFSFLLSLRFLQRIKRFGQAKTTGSHHTSVTLDAPCSLPTKQTHSSGL